MGIDNFAHDENASEASSSKERMPVPSLPPPRPHAEHGPTIDHKITQDNVVPASPDLLWSRIRREMREPLAEFWGVFILIMFGDGVVAQVVLSNGQNGDYQSISWGWG
jgi:aquaglyceroporin related protein, other eukaryote